MRAFSTNQHRWAYDYPICCFMLFKAKLAIEYTLQLTRGFWIIACCRAQEEKAQDEDLEDIWSWEYGIPKGYACSFRSDWCIGWQLEAWLCHLVCELHYVASHTWIQWRRQRERSGGAVAQYLCGMDQKQTQMVYHNFKVMEWYAPHLILGCSLFDTQRSYL